MRALRVAEFADLPPAGALCPFAQLNVNKKGFRLWNYYRAQLFYILGSCVFWGGLILLHDPQPPDNVVDAVFMTVREQRVF